MNIKTIFSNNVPIVAVKAATGECFGASGAFQAIAAVMSIQRSIIPSAAGRQGNKTFVAGDIKSTEVERKMDCFLITSIYPGGENAALVIRS